MLRVLQYEEGNVISKSLEEMEFDKVRWIDCVNPSQEELQALSKKIFISHQDLERCLDDGERPIVEDIQNFTLLIFKSPVRNPQSVTTTSLSLLISEKLLITFRKHELHGIAKVQGNPKLGHMFEKGTTHLAYQVLERIMDDYFAILEFVEDRIDKIEERVFTRPEPSLVKEIFALKKTLIYFHKALAANREVASNITKDLSAYVDANEVKSFRYVSDDILQLIDVVATYRDILTGALDIYLGSVSNNMNIVMKKMAAFGAVILIPTLIAGVYGMNFVHMPELYWEYGYYGALGLMAFSVLFLIYYFKRKKWF